MSDSSVILWTVAHQSPLSMGFPRQEFWHGLLFPSPGDLPSPGIEPTSPVLEGRFFTTEPPGSPLLTISSLHSLSHVQLFVTHGLQRTRLPCPSLTPGACSNSCPSNWWYHPTISSCVVPYSSCLQSLPSIRVFSSESVVRIKWPKYWSFSFSISPSNEYSGLISFRMDWLDLLAVQGILKSLLQHHSSKA